MAEPSSRGGFLWGAACSSYQTEGGNRWSDWWQWEDSGKKIKGGTPSGNACDFWNRYESFFDMAAQAGMNALRISLEWARINPKQDEWSEEALTHYRAMIRAMRQRGLEPIVTLWHFTLPQWLTEQGGWLNPNAVHYFQQYVQRVKDTLGTEVQWWLTLNEPSVYLYKGFLEGTWPPERKGALGQAMRIRHILMQAHRSAYRILKTQTNRVGITANLSWDTVASPWNLLSRLLAWLPPRGNDWSFLAAVRNECDFIGLNYYFHNTVRFNILHPFASVVSSNPDPNRNSDMGWEIAPEGLYRVIQRLRRQFHKPIFITENGIADAADQKRAAFIQDHVQWMKKAQAEGIPILGYLYWSLMDNFEWQDGFWPRFGLIEMDYEKMQATPRQSLWEYKKIIEKESLR
jgi:beta-glucosidase